MSSALIEVRVPPASNCDYFSKIFQATQVSKLPLRRRGWLYIVADAPRLALHDFEASIQLDSTSGDAYNGRGAARLRLGEHRQAVADAEKALSVGDPKPDLYYKAARVYAVAAIAAAAEARKKGQETVTLVSRYQDRAADLLRETLKRLPPERRASFLKDVILKDPQLRTLKRRVSSLERPGEGAPNPLAPEGEGGRRPGEGVESPSPLRGEGGRRPGEGSFFPPPDGRRPILRWSKAG